ncbi:MAG: response regulator [Deltaproteobacteria bacterium]|nr:response regulator [Deltaproteobacteria bacterium]
MTSPSESRPRVLVVDDDEMVLHVLRASLEADYEVLTASSGEAALKVLGSVEAAVLLTDQRMPGISGVELAKEACKLHPHLVPIIISAYTDPIDIIAAINEAQVFRFARKPWDLDDLLHTVQQAAQRHRLSSDNARLVCDLRRRSQALEILQQVFAAAAVAAGAHPADVMLGHLQEVVPYDLAGLLLVADGAKSGTLQLSSGSAVAIGNIAELRDQVLELFALCGGVLCEEHALRVNATPLIDPEAPLRAIGSQAQVPLVQDGRPVGVLVVQSFAVDAYPPDVARLLDLLANGTADAVQRARQSTSRQWQLVEAALAAVPNAILLFDAAGEVLVANPAGRRVLEGLSGSLWELLAVWPEDVLTAAAIPIRREFRVGERIVVAELGRTADAAAADAKVVVVLRDVSMVEAENAARRDFLSTLTHEIRTPLTSVIATLELLLNGAAGDLPEKQREYLEVADEACESLNHLITNMLDLEKFERGKVELQCRSMDAATVVHGVAARFAAAAAMRGLSIAVETGPEPVPLVADQHRLEQILSNLLGNAVKFARPSSVVRLSLGESDAVRDFVVLGVHNDGPPIPPGEWSTLFARFRQAKRERELGGGRGTGLGLAIALSLARAHGGTLMVESGKAGTSFYLALPAEPAPVVAEALASETPCWVDVAGTPADRAAIVAVLQQAGLKAALLPADAAEAEAVYRAQGDGITLTSGRLGGRPAIDVVPNDPARLRGIATALATLGRLRDRRLSITPNPGADLWRVLAALGLKEAHEGKHDLDLVLYEMAGGPATRLMVLAEQLTLEARRRAPVRTLHRRLRLAGGAEAYGIVRLSHVNAFRAIYGQRGETALKAALMVEMRQVVARLSPGLAWLALDSSMLFSGPRKVIERVLEEAALRLPSLARLHYRKQDRDEGCLHLGGTDVPLVEVATQVLDAAVSESHLISALGL